MKKIVFLVGPDKSGKTTLQNNLIKNWPGKYSRILSTTTRKPRDGEIDGVDYNFMEEEEFVKKMDLGNHFLQTVNYGAYYGTEMSNYEVSQDIGLFVCTTEGILDTVNALKAVGLEFDYSIVFFAVTDKLIASRGFDERTSRGDIRADFYKAYSKGDFSGIKTTFVQDGEVNDKLHEEINKKL